ncbi:hypothetical protein TNCV_4195571 [Trichonephila clavipes]|nr:hypothetical protein TNCV_4195571 [Trichonephila clavipes]
MKRSKEEKETVCGDTTFEPSCSSEPHLLTQEDLNDVIRDLKLSIKQSKMIGSRKRDSKEFGVCLRSTDSKAGKDVSWRSLLANQSGKIYRQNFEVDVFPSGAVRPLKGLEREFSGPFPLTSARKPKVWKENSLPGVNPSSTPFLSDKKKGSSVRSLLDEVEIHQTGVEPDEIMYIIPDNESKREKNAEHETVEL